MLKLLSCKIPFLSVIPLVPVAVTTFNLRYIVFINKFHGATLLEVLVSLFLVSLIIVSFDGMELTLLQGSRQTYFNFLALLQLQSMTERLTALSHYNDLLEQIKNWNDENQKMLPEGRGEIHGTFPHYQITLCWRVLREKHKCINSNLTLEDLP